MKTKRFFVLVAVAALLAITTLGDRAAAQSANAANKVHVSASTMDVFVPGAPITILATSMKTSTNADLILSVTSECAIALSDVDVDTTGFGSSIRETDFGLAVVRIWVEIDGAFVPVAAGDPDGKVTFCRRDNTQTTFVGTSSFGGESEFDATRYANSFNWVKKNVGNGTHTIDVKAEAIYATASTQFNSFAGFIVGIPPAVSGVVGRRTLIAEAVSQGK